MRSRVMPGSFVTIDRRVPVRRLNSVDLPTLGRPTMTMDGSFVFIFVFLRVSIRRGEPADFGFGFAGAASSVSRLESLAGATEGLDVAPRSLARQLRLRYYGSLGGNSAC